MGEEGDVHSMYIQSLQPIPVCGVTSCHVPVFEYTSTRDNKTRGSCKKGKDTKKEKMQHGVGTNSSSFVHPELRKPAKVLLGDSSSLPVIIKKYKSGAV